MYLSLSTFVQIYVCCGLIFVLRPVQFLEPFHFFATGLFFFKPLCYEYYSMKSCSCPLFPNFLHPLPATQTIVVFLSMLAMCLLLGPLLPLQALFYIPPLPAVTYSITRRLSFFFTFCTNWGLNSSFLDL